MNKSLINKLSKEELQEIINTSTTILEVLKKIGVDPYNGNHKTLNKRIINEDINIDILIKNRKDYLSIKTFTNKYKLDNLEKEDIFIKDSTIGTSTIKTQIIKNNLIKYTCEKCNNSGQWLNNKLSLQLDHINGINNDHRLQNLRFLCPNCHSQTETFGSKNRKTPIKKCIDCNTTIFKTSKRCIDCSNKASIDLRSGKRKFEISKEDLENLIKQYPMTKIGEMLGVCDNSVKKRCILLNIDYKALRK